LSPVSCTLILGEQAWRIEAGDRAAASIVAQLADTMQLDSTDGAGRFGFPMRYVRVITQGSADPAPDGLVCRLKELSGDEALFCHFLEPVAGHCARRAGARLCAAARRAGRTDWQGGDSGRAGGRRQNDGEQSPAAAVGLAVRRCHPRAARCKWRVLGPSVAHVE